tara:strand:- start:2579 stop:3754 length:1176 start_codon:yes stop_codon:yes gene_type:complete
MSYLINRNPSGRIICLHTLLRYLYKRYGTNPFTLTGLKYDENAKENIHQVCPILTKHPSIPFKVCPFLENPLSAAKCYLTQSVQEDKQKSKSVSDAFNALEGMGFVKRLNKNGKITKEGIEFLSEPYESPNTLRRLRKALVGYGPFVGLLYELSSNQKTGRSTVKLGYPVTNEKIVEKGRSVTLSTGSQQDTITRTRSVLFLWATTAGFVLPEGFPQPSDVNKWHVSMLNYVKSKKWTKNVFINKLPKDLFQKKLYVDQPLFYNAMTKSTKALRERNQEAERSITLKYEPIINNRRFAIVYSLAKKSDKDENLNFKKLIVELEKYPHLFVVNKNEFEEVMEKELGIANICGIPFIREKGILKPLTKINLDVLKTGALGSLISTLDNIISKI